jgi:hypothetical protein
MMTAGTARQAWIKVIHTSPHKKYCIDQKKPRKSQEIGSPYSTDNDLTTR